MYDAEEFHRKIVSEVQWLREHHQEKKDHDQACQTCAIIEGISTWVDEVWKNFLAEKVKEDDAE